MKAAVFEELNVMTVKEVPLPVVGDDDALMRVRTCAICGSDIRIFHNGHPEVQTPTIIGHEVCGDIVAVGKNVTKLRVGDRVALGADIPCGQCAMCQEGHGNYCENKQGLGHSNPGGFAEYCLINGFMLRSGPVQIIPDHMTYEQGAVAEPLGCILNGMEHAKPKLNDIAVIMGAGPIGCMMIPVLYRFGCAKVIITDPNKNRLELAKRFMADSYICSSEEDVIKRVLDETDGLGAHLVITANPSWQSHVDAMKMVRIQGTVCLFGGLPQGRKIPEFDTNVIHYKELTVTGSHGSLPRQHKAAVEMIASGKIDIDPIITHRFPLDQINDAFAAAEGQQGMKVIVTP
ncbi:MAG: alcohol dehydrogenase catalytic domain-containing protein [Clostridia bacterium]|nr:alcohol dehydrogenase catalytic domain-containing protein [Clostridia bacterium]